MNESHSDALVLFGATGDLAYEQIFPALQAMTRRGHLDRARHWRRQAGAGPSTNCGHVRARASRRMAGRIPTTSRRLAARLSYVAGDYQDPATFDALRQALGSATRPLFYLAIPPSLFGTVAVGLGAVRLRRTRLVSSSKSRSAAISCPRRRSTRRSTNLSPSRRSFASITSRQRAGAEPSLLPVRQRVSRADLESPLCRERADHDGGSLRRSRAAAASTRDVGAVRDVIQNHLLQVLSLLAMDEPATGDGPASTPPKWRCCKAVRPLRLATWSADNIAAIEPKPMWRRIRVSNLPRGSPRDRERALERGALSHPQRQVSR